MTEDALEGVGASRQDSSGSNGSSGRSLRRRWRMMSRRWWIGAYRGSCKAPADEDVVRLSGHSHTGVSSSQHRRHTLTGVQVKVTGYFSCMSGTDSKGNMIPLFAQVNITMMCIQRRGQGITQTMLPHIFLHEVSFPFPVRAALMR